MILEHFQKKMLCKPCVVRACRHVGAGAIHLRRQRRSGRFKSNLLYDEATIIQSGKNTPTR
jgi:hypothetical protein